MKTNELTGAALDWAVAEAEGFFKNDMASVRDGVVDVFYFDEYSPSTNWALGGEIIERERISLLDQGGDCWLATCVWTEMFGDTHLIAAMRSYVGSKLGDEVQIPEELIK
jgi:hypothetical protein